MALRAASLKSLTMRGSSSALNRRGGDQSSPSRPGVTPLSVHDMGASPFGWNPVLQKSCYICQINYNSIRLILLKSTDMMKKLIQKMVGLCWSFLLFFDFLCILIIDWTMGLEILYIYRIIFEISWSESTYHKWRHDPHAKFGKTKCHLSHEQHPQLASMLSLALQSKFQVFQDIFKSNKKNKWKSW